MVLTHGSAEPGAALATVLVAIRSGNLILATLTGIGTVWMLRTFIVEALENC
jgi:branched-subunit amino acid transport protein